MIESQNIEFKESWKDEYLKTLCAFANTGGGVLKVGIDDTGRPVGVHQVKRLLRELPNKIRNKLGITPSVVTETVAENDIISITVSPSRSRATAGTTSVAEATRSILPDRNSFIF